MNVPSYDRGRPIGSPGRTDCSSYNPPLPRLAYFETARSHWR